VIEFPDTWNKWTFGEFADISPKVSLKKGHEYSFIPMENVNAGYKFVKAEQRKIYDAGGAKFCNGDTIFARITPCLENGKIAQVTGITDNKGFGSTEYIVFRGKEKISDSDFIYYLSKTEWFKQNAVNSMVGASGRQRADAKFISNTHLTLPPLPIQTKIAAILSAYDDLIENNLKQIRLLEEMAQITYQEWFARLKFPNHENTHIDETTGLPIGWEYKKLGEHVELIKDSVLPENLDNIRYIGLEHIPRKSIVLSEYGNSDNVNSLKLIIQKGDILFGKIRPYFHKVGVALFDCISSTDIIVMRVIEKQLHGIILQNVFSENFVKAAVQSSNGTKMPRASWDVLKNYQIIIPEKTVLTQFAEMSDNIISTISNLANQNQHLKEARDILLPRLMTGKITVDDL
jgi:type I restriction enzyme S subunit